MRGMAGWKHRDLRGALPRGRTAAEEGQNLVELAAVVPLLLIIIFGIFDFGRLYHAHVTIANAAREGPGRAPGFPSRTGMSASGSWTNAVTK